MNIRMKFLSDGSIVFLAAVAMEQVNAWRALVRPTGIWYIDILDNVVEELGRLQSPVPDQEGHAMADTLQRFYKTFIPDSEANDFRWVEMLAGRRDLPVRRDFQPVQPGDDPFDVTAIHGGMVVALENDTCFDVYGWNHTVAHRSDRKEITLHKGDVFVYRGDLIFAPVTNDDANNVYLHAYLDTPTSERLENHQPDIVPTVNDTAGMEDPFCFVWDCKFWAADIIGVRRHLNRFHGFRFHHTSPPEE
ncbi:hypothetical protein PF003_g5128 [Phytophthora fragariae]|nr:hypothetical protein PF003_g5128 [Phytophthora fragariae]